MSSLLCLISLNLVFQWSGNAAGKLPCRSIWSVLTIFPAGLEVPALVPWLRFCPHLCPLAEAERPGNLLLAVPKCSWALQSPSAPAECGSLAQQQPHYCPFSSLPFWQEASLGSSSQWQECLNPSVESLRDTCPAIHTQKSSGPVKEHIKFYKCKPPPHFLYLDTWARSNWFQNWFLFVFFDIQSVNFCFPQRAFGMWVENRCCIPQNRLWTTHALSRSHQKPEV